MAVSVFDDAVHERRADDVDEVEAVGGRVVAVHALPGAGVDAAVSGLHDGQAVVVGQVVLLSRPAGRRIEGGDAVSVGGDPEGLPDVGDIGDGRPERDVRETGIILECLVFRIEAAEIALFAADPDLPVGAVADGPDGIADERIRLVVGDETAEAGLIGHPAPEATVPGARPDIAVAVAEQAADTLAAEGGGVQLVRELLLDRLGRGVVDEQAVGGADPVQSVLIQQALDFRLVQDHLPVYQGVRGSGIHVCLADFVNAVAQKQPAPTYIFYLLEGGVGTVGPDAADISARGVKQIDIVVARREDEVPVGCHAGHIGGE